MSLMILMVLTNLVILISLQFLSIPVTLSLQTEDCSAFFPSTARFVPLSLRSWSCWIWLFVWFRWLWDSCQRCHPHFMYPFVRTFLIHQFFYGKHKQEKRSKIIFSTFPMVHWLWHAFMTAMTWQSTPGAPRLSCHFGASKTSCHTDDWSTRAWEKYNLVISIQLFQILEFFWFTVPGWDDNEHKLEHKGAIVKGASSSWW